MALVVSIRITSYRSYQKIMESIDKDQGKKNIPKIQTFTVPFTLGEIKENISISTF